VRTVRGYQENQLVRDNGIAGSVELRIPVLQTQGGSQPSGAARTSPSLEESRHTRTEHETPPILPIQAGIHSRALT
jgi:hypothetical protein